MADVKFLSNLVIDGNIDLTAGAGYQIKNASFESLTADPTTNLFEGRMIYRSDTNEVRAYNGSSWGSIAGDIVGVTAGNGLSGGGTSGTVSLAVSVDDTTIEINSDSVRAKTAAIADGGTGLATADQIHTFVTGQGYLTAHPTISGAASDSSNSGRTYIQSLGFDSNGHVTSVSTATETVTNSFRTVTAGGNTLGSSETLAFVAGSNVTISESAGAVTIASTDTNTQLTDAQVRSKISGTGLISYNSSTGVISTTANNYSLPTASSSVLGGIKVGTNLSIDGNGVLSSTDTNTQLSNEQVQDIVGAMVSGNSESNISVTYQDSDGTLDFSVTQRSDESIQDLVGAMFSGNTETGITATYQDGDGTIDLVVSAISDLTVADNTDNAAHPVLFVSDAGSNQEVKVDGTSGNQLTYNPSTQTLNVNNIVVAGTQTTNNVEIIETSNGVVFEGATADAFETTLQATDPTADRDIYLPNRSGTIALTTDIVTANTTTNGIGRVAAGGGIDVSVSSGVFTVSAEDSSASNKGVVIVAAGEGIDVTYSSGTATVAAENASTSNKGVVELATSAEALAGSDSSRAVTPSGLAARSFTAAIGDGTATSIDVTHNLGTRNVMVQMYDSSSYETVYAEVSRSSTSAINCRFNSAPASGDITVLITKID